MEPTMCYWLRPHRLRDVRRVIRSDQMWGDPNQSGKGPSIIDITGLKIKLKIKLKLMLKLPPHGTDRSLSLFQTSKSPITIVLLPTTR